MSTDSFHGVLDHPAFAAVFQRQHQADLDQIEADLIARARRLDAADRLTEAAGDALVAEYEQRVQVLIDRFATDFIAAAINSALAVEQAAQASDK